MSLVKINPNGQVTLPSTLRKRAGLSAGDLLEAKLGKGGEITLTPRSLLDQHIEEGLGDIAKGRTYGPFDTAEKMIESLQRNMKARANTTKTKRAR